MSDRDLRKLLNEQLAKVNDGAVTVSIQDGKVLHITRTEQYEGTGDDNGSAGFPLQEDALQKLAELVKSLRFGTVTINVKNGKVVGVEKSEKIKL